MAICTIYIKKKDSSNNLKRIQKKNPLVSVFQSPSIQISSFVSPTLRKPKSHLLWQTKTSNLKKLKPQRKTYAIKWWNRWISYQNIWHRGGNHKHTVFRWRRRGSGGGGDPPVLQSAGSFVHWQDIKSPNYRQRCVRTAAAPEAQLGPSMISECVNGWIDSSVLRASWTLKYTI